MKDPETGASVRDRLRGPRRRSRPIRRPAAATRARAAKASPAAGGGDLPLGALGSGSDYTPFVQHLGVASINLGFGGEGESGGVYHSAYDTFEHYERFGDPGFVYGVALAKTGGPIVLRAADAETPPLQLRRLRRYGLAKN